MRPSRDLVSDHSGHPAVGRPERVGFWLRENPDLEAIDGRTAHRLFMVIAQFPAMRASWLREIVGGSSGEVSRHLGRFVRTGLVAVFDGRHYLPELGMKRAANMSRVLPAVIRSRHGAYLDRWYREHEQHHNDGVNRLVVRFAREGAEVAAGWRGEVNVPGLTQVRPDLLVQVTEGTLGAGTHYIDSIHPHVHHFQVIQGPSAPFCKLIVPLILQPGYRARRYRCLFSQQSPHRQVEVTFGKAMQVQLGDQLSNLPGPVDEQRQQPALELLFGVADSWPPQLYRS